MSLETAPRTEPVAYRAALQDKSRLDVRPSAEQEERRSRLRRFNWWVLYLPVGLVILAWLALIGGLVWLMIVGGWFAMDTNQDYYRQLMSGVADIFTMLMLLPALLLCTIPIVAAVALFVVRRQRASDRQDETPSLPIFWRIENIIITIRDTVARSAPRVARPLINAHATAAFIKRFLIVVKRTFSQEIFGNDDNR